MPPEPRRPLCAICDETNQTTRLCDACRADPANDGWSECEPAELIEDVDSVVGDLRLGDLASRRIRTDGERKRAILQLIHGYTVRVAYRTSGRLRARSPWVWRRRALNLSEVAFLVGCTPQAVVKTIRKVLA